MNQDKIDRIIARNKENRQRFLDALGDSDGAADQTEELTVHEPVEPQQDDLETIEA